MPHDAHVAHHVRGRMRLRVPQARGNRRLLERIQQLIAPLEGVRQVEIRPATGSLVVHYEPARHDDFAQFLRAHGEQSQSFALAAPEVSEADRLADTIEREADFLAAHSSVALRIVTFFRQVNDEIKRATDNTLDLKVLFPLSLAGYLLLHRKAAQMSTPLWVTLGMSSFNSFLALHKPLAQTSVERQGLELPPAPPGGQVPASGGAGYGTPRGEPASPGREPAGPPARGTQGPPGGRGTPGRGSRRSPRGGGERG